MKVFKYLALVFVLLGVVACGDEDIDKDAQVESEPVLRPAWSVSVSEVDFGRIELYRDEARAVVTIENVGEAPSEPLVARLGGYEPEDFYISDDETCRGEALDIGESCKLYLAMRDNEIGEFTATLIVTAGDSTVGVVRLFGEVYGVGSDSINLMPRSMSFGRVPVGEQSAIREFVIERQRRGGDSGAPTVRIGEGGDDFRIVRNSCATLGFTLGDQCTVGVRFAPASAGVSRTSLYAGLAGTEWNALLSGEGWRETEPEPLPPAPAELRISPNAHQFGTMNMERVFTVTNIGDEDTGEMMVTLDGLDPGQFALGNNECVGTLPGMAECQIEVRWAPTAFGDHTAGLLVEATPGGFARATLDAQ